MFKIVNKNIILQSVLLILLFAYSVYLIFNRMSIPEIAGETPQINLFFYILRLPVPLIKTIVLCILILQLVSFQLFFAKSNFTESRTLFPSAIYLFLMIANNAFEVISPVFFINMTVLLLLLFSSSYEEFSVKTIALISGGLIGLSFFVEPSSPLLLGFIFASLFINRFTKMKDAIVAIFGFSIPLIYFFAISFLKGEMYTFHDIYGNVSFLGFYHSFHSLSVADGIYIAALIIILLYIIIFLQFIFAQKLIILRRRLMGVNLMTFILLILSFISTVHSPQLLTWLFIPIACYFGIATQYKQRWLFHDLLIILIITLLWI